MNKASYRFYLWATSGIERCTWLRFFGIDQPRIQAFRNPTWADTKISGLTAEGSIHFHAASAGELEILIPVIKFFAGKLPLVITIFSSSARKGLDRLANDLKEHPILYAGYSPCENEWEFFMKHFGVKKSIISKYEAWPGLWAALAHLNIPLIMIQSQMRSSLIWVKRLLIFFGAPLPRVFFYGPNPDELKKLKAMFPTSVIKEGQDPRWVQVFERASHPHPRVEELRSQHSKLPRPYAVVGSAWKEDLDFLFQHLKNFSGTVWVVPHSLQSDSVGAMKRQLMNSGLSNTVLVAEAGFLLELYSLADWVWVGGGFGKGVHSTMEPAVYGVPIACGTVKASKFPEIAELCSAGQLTLCSNSKEFELFLEKTKKGQDRGLVQRWHKKTDSFSSLVEDCLRIR